MFKQKKNKRIMDQVRKPMAKPGKAILSKIRKKEDEEAEKEIKEYV